MEKRRKKQNQFTFTRNVCWGINRRNLQINRTDSWTRFHCKIAGWFFKDVNTTRFCGTVQFCCAGCNAGYHWNNSQAILHPFVAYYLNGNTLVSKTFCVISDEMRHDTIAVHKFMSVSLPQIKRILPNLIKCYYFSDGTGSQYKNHKNFAHLCDHKADFGVDACDGIGDTVKHLVARASLQMVSGQTIISSNEMFNWCKDNISGISFIYVSAEDVKKHSELINLEKRYKSASTVPGTRSYHCIIPTSTNELQLKRISADPYHSNFQFGKTKTRISLNDIIPGQYYACMYDDD